MAAAPWKRIPAGLRRRGAGALTFSGAVVEAPPCSPGAPRSRWSSRNGIGTGWDGRCGDGGRVLMAGAALRCEGGMASFGRAAPGGGGVAAPDGP